MSKSAVLDRPTSQASPIEVLNPLQPVSDALGRVFASQQEESQVTKARRIMGGLVTKLSDEELEAFIVEFQYLIDEWLDDFERQAFGGKTLKQVLGQG